MLRKSVVVLSIILWGLTAQIDPAAAEQPAASESQASAASIEISVADTLSGIAARMRLDESVSIQQVMLAIQATNPNAFIGGNINRMRSDVVLQAPSLQEIKSIDAELAFYEVARQNREVSSIQLDRRIAELENQLALRLDEANRIRLEREGMDSQLMVLETEIVAAQEILRSRDQQLAQLQGSLAEIARLAEQEAVLAAAETAAIVAESTEALQSEGQGVRLVNDIRHIFTNNPLIMSFGILLLILVIVMRLRGKKSDNLVDETTNDIAYEELQSADDGVDVKAKEESKKAVEVTRGQSPEEKPEREMEDDRSFERDDNDHDKSVRLSDSDSGDGIKQE
ncbi:MAG: FimV/HubP family polar landmark protein, partial [Pseudomonadota bacterium]|nr:FimV/HubP family polar landmark protein [Pseudomonadota bacterium]